MGRLLSTRDACAILGTGGVDTSSFFIPRDARVHDYYMYANMGSICHFHRRQIELLLRQSDRLWSNVGRCSTLSHLGLGEAYLDLMFDAA